MEGIINYGPQRRELINHKIGIKFHNRMKFCQGWLKGDRGGGVGIVQPPFANNVAGIKYFYVLQSHTRGHHCHLISIGCQERGFYTGCHKIKPQILLSINVVYE